MHESIIHAAFFRSPMQIANIFDELISNGYGTGCVRNFSCILLALKVHFVRYPKILLSQRLRIGFV